MMNKFCLVIISFILGISFTFAQGENGFTVDTSAIIIHKDSRIDSLIKKQAEVNEKAIKESKRTGKGYSLMIVSTKNREEAVAARTKIFTLFPDLKPILYHQSPYFKVKAGAFEDRKEAEDYKKRLDRHFSKGVHIMTDTIEMKPKKSYSDND